MKATQAETSAGRIFDLTALTVGALGVLLIFTLTLPLVLSKPFPMPKRSDWIIPAARGPAPGAATYRVASLTARRLEASGAIETALPAETGLPASAAPRSPVETTSAEAAISPMETISSEVAEIPFEATSSTAMKIASLLETVPAERGVPVVRFSFADRWTSAMAVPEVASTVQMPAEAARIEIPDQRTVPQAQRRDVGVMEEVDQYLWEVYQRTAVKSDSSGDFTWKDPAAAKHAGMSMPDYVIRGMDADFREQLYHAGRAMDGNGIKWSMLSAFRDDYRQGLASGFKAHVGNSMHGGSRATGGYGHGQAVDITTADGDDSAAWHWIDAHGAKYGLRRPIPGPDPAHVQASGKWHEIAIALRNARIKFANQEAQPSDSDVAVTSAIAPLETAELKRATRVVRPVPRAPGPRAHTGAGHRASLSPALTLASAAHDP